MTIRKKVKNDMPSILVILLQILYALSHIIDYLVMLM